MQVVATGQLDKSGVLHARKARFIEGGIGSVPALSANEQNLACDAPQKGMDLGFREAQRRTAPEARIIAQRHP